MSPYGVSKLAAELYVALLRGAFGANLTVRLFSVLARDEEAVIWDS